MHYLLGFKPNEKTSHEVSAVLRKLGSVFEGQDIPVRWSTPENYHITIHLLGGNLNILRKMYLNWKLKNLHFKKFDIKLGKIRLGRNRNFRGMVYVDFQEGGEELRDLRLQIAKLLKIRDLTQFVPHITIGRINKDLTNQEYSNLTHDIENVSREIDLNKVQFKIDSLSLIKKDEQDYLELKKFLVS